MRIGVIWNSSNNAYYRAIDPLKALEARGHEIVWPEIQSGMQSLVRLCTCDVVHVYRAWDEEVRIAVRELVRRRVGVVYDNDDDYSLIDRDASNYRTRGGFEGERVRRMMLAISRLAHVSTTTTEPLAERLRASGLRDVRVIPNQLNPRLYRPQNRHEGVRIGWVAGGEHRSDAQALGVAEFLGRLVDRHPNLSVETFGVDLRLPERYHHVPIVPFHDLPREMARWDVAIAPLADIAFNRMRSDIKLKEYAASGLPWLASPVGPYVGLGEQQGGRLVRDEEWFEALDEMVASRRARRRLARKARRWAAGQTIDSTVGAWEAALNDALRRADVAAEAV